jgi:Putative prokaryotic signal transducing protein
MADGELEELSKEASGLTDIACDALREEMTRRGLPFQQSASSEYATTPSDHPNLVVLAVFTDRSRADLARNILESAGIRSLVSDHGLGRVTGEMGGQLWVQERDADAANALITAKLPSENHEVGEGDEADDLEAQAPGCPQCQSNDIFFDGPDVIAEADESSDTNEADDSDRPEKVPAGVWKCLSCGKEWIDEQEPTAS